MYDANVSQCVCPQFQFVGSDGLCVCIPNYFLYDGKCIRTCPLGFVRSGNTCVSGSTAVTTCPGDQILSDGKCTCAGSNYIVNGTCSTCPRSTYYNLTSQTCIMCLTNCEICFSFTSCSTCKPGFSYNQTSNTCQVNRICLDNQVLKNGVCECNTGFVEINGVCGICLAGAFYNSTTKNCDKCVPGCLSCANGNTCTTCLPNYLFNVNLGYCAPICGANETIINGTCECTNNTFRINGVCSRCQSNQFYDTVSKFCVPCILNCLTCTTATTCDKCILTHYVNPTTKVCETSNCPVNETITNGKCDCVEGTYRVSGTCSVCKNGEFYNNQTQVCK